MNYFAYGSNMSLVRLQERVPSAKLIGVFSLKSHQLKFHKSSKDGSGKCDIFETSKDSDTVFGALFEIDSRDKFALDKAEGLGYGYDEKKVKVHSDSQGDLEAITYYAIKIDASLKPYSWYLNHVVVGAKEVKVPATYLSMIESTESIEDSDKKRDLKQRAMYS